MIRKCVRVAVFADHILCYMHYTHTHTSNSKYMLVLRVYTYVKEILFMVSRNNCSIESRSKLYCTYIRIETFFFLTLFPKHIELFPLPLLKRSLNLITQHKISAYLPKWLLCLMGILSRIQEWWSPGITESWGYKEQT